MNIPEFGSLANEKSLNLSGHVTETVIKKCLNGLREFISAVTAVRGS